METWKILLITFLSAILLGCVAGVIIGKIQVRRLQNRGRLFSRKELLILAGVALVGVACVLAGVFFPSKNNESMPGGEMMPPDGMGITDGATPMLPRAEDGTALPEGGEQPAGDEGEPADGEGGPEDGEAEPGDGEGEPEDAEAADGEAGKASTASGGTAKKSAAQAARPAGGGAVIIRRG